MGSCRVDVFLWFPFWMKVCAVKTQGFPECDGIKWDTVWPCCRGGSWYRHKVIMYRPNHCRGRRTISIKYFLFFRLLGRSLDIFFLVARIRIIFFSTNQYYWIHFKFMKHLNSKLASSKQREKTRIYCHSELKVTLSSCRENSTLWCHHRAAEILQQSVS